MSRAGVLLSKRFTRRLRDSEFEGVCFVEIDRGTNAAIAQIESLLADDPINIKVGFASTSIRGCHVYFILYTPRLKEPTP